jgi:hypothetical protein
MDHSGHDMSGMSPSSTMSMISSTMSMVATATASATASSADDMSNMDMSSSSSDSGMHMMMSMGTFHWSSSGDGIWLDSWVPSSEGAYIGACFGLFFFAIISRSLPALEAYFMKWRTMRDNKIESNILTAQPVSYKLLQL